jgi:hypothetical protein
MAFGVGLIGLGMVTKPHILSLRELEAAGHVQRLIEDWLAEFSR